MTTGAYCKLKQYYDANVVYSVAALHTTLVSQNTKYCTVSSTKAAIQGCVLRGSLLQAVSTLPI